MIRHRISPGFREFLKWNSYWFRAGAKPPRVIEIMQYKQPKMKPVITSIGGTTGCSFKELYADEQGRYRG